MITFEQGKLIAVRSTATLVGNWRAPAYVALAVRGSSHRPVRAPQWHSSVLCSLAGPAAGFVCSGDLLVPGIRPRMPPFVCRSVRGILFQTSLGLHLRLVLGRVERCHRYVLVEVEVAS